MIEGVPETAFWTLHHTGYPPPPLRWCLGSADWPSLRDLRFSVTSHEHRA